MWYQEEAFKQPFIAWKQKYNDIFSQNVPAIKRWSVYHDSLHPNPAKLLKYQLHDWLCTSYWSLVPSSWHMYSGKPCTQAHFWYCVSQRSDRRCFQHNGSIGTPESIQQGALAWAGLNRAWASQRECARRVTVATTERSIVRHIFYHLPSLNVHM